MHFPKGQAPPVNGFWSLTMYDAQYFFVPNPLNRYTLSPRDALRYNKDGSLDLYLSMGLPAVQAGGQPPPQLNDIASVGYFVSVDSGSVAKRFAIGFGSGAPQLQTVVEVYVMSDKGLRRLGSAELGSTGPKGPGEALPLAIAVASGNPIGLIVSSAAKVEGEVSGRTTAEGSAKRTAKEIAEQLKVGAQRQGWI